MGGKRAELQEDLSGLLVQSIAEQAAAKAWERFENALNHLDKESRVLLLQHFRGVSIEQMSRESRIDPTQLRHWISQKKRELIRFMKEEHPVKQ